MACQTSRFITMFKTNDSKYKYARTIMYIASQEAIIWSKCILNWFSLLRTKAGNNILIISSEFLLYSNKFYRKDQFNQKWKISRALVYLQCIIFVKVELVIRKNEINVVQPKTFKEINVCQGCARFMCAIDTSNFSRNITSTFIM